MVKQIFNSSSLRKNFFFLIAVILAIINIGCEEKVTTTEEAKISFNEFYVEKGNDTDSSFISFKGTIKNSNTLLIETTSWAVLGTGYNIERQNLNREILLVTMGECGTVLTRIWARMERITTITAAEADTLDKISFTNFRDTLTVYK
jgi:hypothetical protein